MYCNCGKYLYYRKKRNCRIVWLDSRGISKKSLSAVRCDCYVLLKPLERLLLISRSTNVVGRLHRL